MNEPKTSSESSAQPAAKAPTIALLDAGERLEWWAAFRQQLRELDYIVASAAEGGATAGPDPAAG